jgi:HEPN domain-containing protein
MLSSLFQPKKMSVRKSEAEQRTWQAVYYTLRFLFWEDSRRRIFRHGLEHGLIREISPAIRKKDGTIIPAEYDKGDIAQLYKEAWEQFQVEFEKEYIHMKTNELVKVAEEYFGYTQQMLLELNAKRLAQVYNRI